MGHLRVYKTFACYSSQVTQVPIEYEAFGWIHDGIRGKNADTPRIVVRLERPNTMARPTTKSERRNGHRSAMEDQRHKEKSVQLRKEVSSSEDSEQGTSETACNSVENTAYGS